MAQQACEGLKTMCRSWSSPFTIWVLRSNSCCHAWSQAPSPTDPSNQPNNSFKFTN